MRYKTVPDVTDESKEYKVTSLQSKQERFLACPS